MDPAAIAAARAKLAAKMGGASLQIGGKGTVRRKPAKSHKPAAVDDKRLQAVLKKQGVNAIPGIEEVVIQYTDGKATVFSSPKRAFGLRGAGRARARIAHRIACRPHPARS